VTRQDYQNQHQKWFVAEFGLSGITMTLNGGAINVVANSFAQTIDLSLAPVVLDLTCSSPCASLSGFDLGGGMYNYTLALSFGDTQMVPIAAGLNADLTVNGTLVGSAQAVPEPGTAMLVGLGLLATLALARARRR
jgi:hypothetical protein